jgi:type III secretion system FlhB-like substrate exporter
VKKAIALRYSDSDEAPVVVSSGEGEVAASIQRAAATYTIPVVCDVPLADALAELRVGDPIPEALYEAVAAILREVAETTDG